LWFNDDKEGVLGMRAARNLEAPSDKPEVFTDRKRQSNHGRQADNTGVNGSYLTSEGKKADAAWGTRGRWWLISAGRLTTSL